MQRVTSIASFLMMMIVLLLGMVMPSLPDLDDGDDNVGWAAVIEAPTKSQASDVSSVRHKHSKAKTVTVVASKETRYRFDEIDSAPASSQSHVSPPLRT